ncbi:uncharacterized protein LOC111917612 isoform X1 [Lactuca sativa]|uniref:Uncharacterized protein n=1 Tax=Lactuca sativa TaxID=4236 RepID=A0A9R1X7K0_LACSA|nr:uncharacterized protein LOC111917612 isoform X1 [Lactuca sativa]KAJ0203800.1 hypothetical protein LSAT_V11C500296920 [Lactuca sativa]
MIAENQPIMVEESDEAVHLYESGSELGSPWLPTNVINDVTEACGDSGEDDHLLFSKRRSILNDAIEACVDDDHHFYFKQRSYNKHRHQPPTVRKSAAAAQPPLLPSPPHWKSFSKDQKPKHPTNWAAGGPGMQAVFLDSSQRSCGTGVFLPRTAGTNIEKPRKPAFAPVLLPSRVVQALNLNVHGLGLQIKPRDYNNNVKGLECDRIRNKKSRDVSSQFCVISQNRSSSPEIFLPKEWTY